MQNSSSRQTTSDAPITSVTSDEKITVTPAVTMDSRLPVDHAALRCAEYACTSAVISV